MRDDEFNKRRFHRQRAQVNPYPISLA